MAPDELQFPGRKRVSSSGRVDPARVRDDHARGSSALAPPGMLVPGVGTLGPRSMPWRQTAPLNSIAFGTHSAKPGRASPRRRLRQWPVGRRLRRTRRACDGDRSLAQDDPPRARCRQCTRSGCRMAHRRRDTARRSTGRVRCHYARVLLQFVPDVPAALREMRRVLRPEGRLLASVPERSRRSTAPLGCATSPAETPGTIICCPGS